jgi:hypothetical protein
MLQGIGRCVMSVALQVLLLVVAIVVAVAGLGAALALRLSARQRARQRRSGAVKGGSAAKVRSAAVVSLAAAAKERGGATRPQTPSVPAAPAVPLTPEQAHQAKLAALQALLALGDAKAERAAESGHGQFADTQPADEEYPATQFVDRGDPAQPVSLLNLDQLPPRRVKT